MQRPAQLVAVLFIVMSLAVCGASAADGVWLDVPFVKQVKNGCGAAVLSMLMQYWQPAQPAKADAHAIQRRLYSESAKGIFASELTAFLQENGYRTFVLQGTWEDLRQQLQKGRPLVVALGNLQGSQSLHYVVVTGLDWRNNLVMLNDPAGDRKLRKMERSEFEKAWHGTGNWLLLAVPESGRD